MNILEILNSRGLHLRQNGNGFAGPCPFCGGEDRFVCWPDQGRGGKWFCRRCESETPGRSGRSGDAIDLLRELDGLSYQEACNQLDSTFSASTPPPGLSHGRKNDVNQAVWRGRAKALVESAHSELLRDTDTQNWLLQEKFLDDSSIKRNMLGVITTGSSQPRSEWGLPDMAVKTDSSGFLPAW